jgi:hypothetical protein
VDKTYRNKKLLQAAQYYPCQFCGADNATTVAAHYQGMWSNKVGKGMGMKPHDAAIAYLCSDCHDLLDGRTKEANFGAAEKHAMFAIAAANTWKSLLIDGRLEWRNST